MRSAVCRFSGLLAAVLVLTCAVSFGQSPIRSKFDLPAQPLADALRLIGAVTNINLLFDPPLVKGRKAPALRAELTVDEALGRLLEGTGIRYEFLGEKTVLLSAGKTSKPDAAASGRVPTDQMRVAQLSPSGGERQGEDNKAALKKPDDAAAKGVPEILVTGSSILNMDIPRSRDNPQPYVIFEREKIAQSGATSIEEFLKNRLPMNSTQQTNSQSAGSVLGNTSNINLRGLGTNQTLILIDGRRLAHSNSAFAAGTPQQSDINGIPLSAIERIEVLPTTASGIYGGSATGGVVNIILRRDYAGAELKATYDNTFDTDSAVRTIDLSTGFSLEEGKTDVLLAAHYSDGNPLVYGDRRFADKARALLLANRGGDYTSLDSSGMPPLGATPNIHSTNGTDLVLKNGTALNSPITFVPAGYAGTDGGAALVPNAGKYNLALGQGFGGVNQSLVNNPTVESVIATVRRQFTPNVQAFVDFSAANNIGQVLYSSTTYTGTVAASAANNPFTTAVNVSFPSNSADTFGQTDQPATVTSNSRRASGGVIIRLPRNWSAGVDYTWDLNRNAADYSSRRNVLSSVNTAITSGAINILRDTNIYAPNFSPYANGSLQLLPNSTTLRNATTRLAGSLMALPGGAITLSSLIENQREKVDEGVFQNGGRVTFINPGRSQSVRSAYLEINTPFVSARNRRAGIEALELQLAVRHDRYETNGASGQLISAPSLGIVFDPQSVVRTTNEVSSTDPTIALRYQPLPDLTLRASYGTGFLPPAIDQLVSTPSVTPASLGTVLDPKRGDTLVGNVLQTFGGNPNLKPERSDSWSAGLIFTPRFIEGLRLSVDYTRIEKTDNIVTLSAQRLLDNEDILPGRVTRGPVQPGTPAGWAGPIIAVDTSLANLATARVDAYDLQLDYSSDIGSWGSLEWFAVSTWQTHLQTQIAPTTPSQETVGFAGGPLKFKANAGVVWKRSQWTAGWTARYFDSYQVYGASAAAATRAALILNQGSDRIPDQMYHDLFATYRFGSATGATFAKLLSDTQLTLGIRNVFNKEPPIEVNQSGGSSSFYSAYGDPRLRSYYITLTRQF